MFMVLATLVVGMVGVGGEDQPQAAKLADSDWDGVPDANDLDPIIANYPSLKWDVGILSLAYDISTQSESKSGSREANTNSKTKSDTFSWEVGADSRVEAGIQVGPNPLKMFKFSATATASASVNRQSRSASEEKKIKEIYFEQCRKTVVGQSKITFSVNLYNFGSTPLVVKLDTIPLMVNGDHCADAQAETYERRQEVEIPAERPEGVPIKFVAQLTDTSNLRLANLLELGESPAINLEKTAMKIYKKGGGPDLIPLLAALNSKDALFVVRTGGGSISWRIARKFGGKSVTLRDAMKAINTLIRREESSDRNFFEFTNAGGIKSVAGYVGKGKWMLENNLDATTTALDEQLPDTFQLKLVEPIEVPWGEVLAREPDPKVVTDADFRRSIAATGLPWHVRDKATGMEMLLVPPGKFMMGMSSGDTFHFVDNLQDEVPQHEVTITKAFYLCRTEVTQEQWMKVMGVNPSLFQQSNAKLIAEVYSIIYKKLQIKISTADEAKNLAEFVESTAKAAKAVNPVEMISWTDCQKFCAKTGMILPTEAQWEYACRAGVDQATYGELDQISWNETNAKLTTHSVGQKAPNALGFYDMIGNVNEWCQDWYEGDYYKSCADGVVDPTGPARSNSGARVLRGGGWYGTAYYCRASFRYANAPGFRFDDLGCRFARTAD